MSAGDATWMIGLITSLLGIAGVIAYANDKEQLGVGLIVGAVIVMVVANLFGVEVR